MNKEVLKQVKLNLKTKERSVEEIVKQLILGQTITIKFFNYNECIEKTGMIIKIDKDSCILHLPNLKIPFTSIVAIIP